MKQNTFTILMMNQNKYLQSFFYASGISGVLILIFSFFGVPDVNTSSWLVIKPDIYNSITKKLVSSFVSCFFHGSFEHLLGNISGFLLFGTYAISVSKKYSLLSFVAGAILPGFFLYLLPHKDNGVYFGFSGVVFTSIGFSLVSFLRTNFEKKSDWIAGIVLIKLLTAIWLLNYFLGAGFWGTLYASETAEKSHIAWQIHLVGLITGLTFAISDRENAWHFLFGSDITKDEEEKIQIFFKNLRQ